MPTGHLGTDPKPLPFTTVLLAAGWIACGSIGDPLPPLLNIPEPVRDLEVRQDGYEIRVACTWPLLTTEGTVPRQVGGFTLWAVDVPDFSQPLTPETINEYRREIATLGPDELAGKQPGDRLVFHSSLPDWPLGQLTVLAVSAFNRTGQNAGYSNQVRLQPLEPPEEPKWVDLSVGEDGVALAWRLARHAEEYGIERATGEQGEFEALGRLAVESFLDRTARWDQDYRYRLRPYRRSQGGWIRGELSVEVAVTPRDTFAPSIPTGLRAVRTAESVALSWLPNRESDLGGYRVLRDGEDLAGLVGSAHFSDESAIAGNAYHYAVTAIDSAGNESEPSPELFVAAAEGE